MKKMLAGMLAITVLMLTGCGDASISVVIPITQVDPPTITSYQFTKNSATESIDGSVNFFAPDSDIDTITIAVFNSSGFQVARTRSALNLPGEIRGSIPFRIDYASFVADTYTFNIFLTDFIGNSSNQIIDTFRVP
jgi:hypothetical protein